MYEFLGPNESSYSIFPMVDPCQIYIYAQKHPMVFSAPGHEKIRTKIPGRQEYIEFFYEEKN